MSALARSETILVVDDEPLILSLTKMTLERFGYKVITAESGKDALRLFVKWPDVRVNLALVDLLMPEMDGIELAKYIHRVRPDLPVLYISAFSSEGPLRPKFARDVPFLAKPFSSLQLTQKIREVLDNPKSEAETG